MRLYSLRKVGAANSTLKAYMRERVAARKLDLSGRDPNDEKLPQDVFSRLVAASENEGKGALNDEELVGNTFLMLLAGHGMHGSRYLAIMG
jgi:cytochrome P450